MSEHTPEDWQAVATEAAEKLREQDELLRSLLEPPRQEATILGMGGQYATVGTNGKGVYQVRFLPELGGRLKKGQTAYLNPQSMCIVEAGQPCGNSQVARVEATYSGNRAKVSVGGLEYMVESLVPGLKTGDSVGVDASFRLVLERYETAKKAFELERIPKVSWDSVGGLDSAIQELRDTVELPYTYQKIYKRYGASPPKGILLHGPPGCGKTLLARALAYSISKKNGNASRKNGGYFFHVKGPEILNEYVGVSERTVRELFSRAREEAGHAPPAVIFIDEAESLLHTRGSGISSDISNTIVPQFLSEMDGLEGTNDVLMLLATNRPDMIDPAILRPGRIDRKVKVPRPDKPAAEEIFRVHLREVPLNGDFPKCTKKDRYSLFAQHAADYLYSPERKFLRVEYDYGQDGFLCYKDFSSGAVVKSIVQRATQAAIKREISGEPGGLTLDDLYKGTELEYKENQDIVQAQGPAELQSLAGDTHRAIRSVSRTWD